MASTRLRAMFGVALVSALPWVAAGDDTLPRGFDSLEALNASYAKQSTDLDRRRIADLDILAAKLKGHEADAAYRELFNVAIARELFAAAQPAADRCRASREGSHEVRALASFVAIVARGENAQHERSLEELDAFVKSQVQAGAATPAVGHDPILTVGEAYLQRLIRAGDYDIARKVCDLIRAGSAPPAVKEHFVTRMNRLNLLGKPAPAIGGLDIDKLPIRLANYHGKVVLVEFWATWCPPCVADVPALSALEAKYKPRGFEILGVNVDTEHENVRDAKTALPVVRRFLVENRVSWTNLLNGDGEADFAKAYGVEHIPANFLIGRDGKIAGFELSGQDREKAITRALGAGA